MHRRLLSAAVAAALVLSSGLSQSRKAKPAASPAAAPQTQRLDEEYTRLMEEQRIPRSEQLTIRHQFHQVALARDQWLQLAAAVLARSVRAAAIVSSPQTAECRVKHFEALLMQAVSGILVIDTVKKTYAAHRKCVAGGFVPFICKSGYPAQ